MAQQIPEDIQKLIDIYTTAQENLVKTIAEKEAKGNVTAYQKSLLSQVFQILKGLDDDAKKWTTETIPQYYDQGIDEAMQGLKDLDQDVDSDYTNFSKINQGAIRTIVNSCYGDLNDANNFVGRRIQDTIRKSGIDAVANKFATGQTVKECKNNIVNSLISEGINGIKDKRGRNISLDAYASTVARSTTREATNTAKTKQLSGLGYDLVKMSSHATTCPLCSMYQGRVYSISGKSSDYPSLDTAFSGDYANIHPNCRHVLMPYIKDLDDNADSLQEYSNRPFEVAEKDKKAIDNYNKQQATKRQLRNDRNKYQDYKLIFGNDAPKSFANFRQIKYNNANEWSCMKDYYKARVKGNISAFSSYSDYKDVIKELTNKVIGVTTSDGIQIKSFSKHMIDRVLGASNDPKTGLPRSGTTVDGVLDALKNSVAITETKPRKLNIIAQVSKKYIGEQTTVSVNPNTGNLIQCNPSDKDTVRRYKNQNEKNI